MSSFLLQVQSKGYSTIIDNGSYSNEHWEEKAKSDKSKVWNNQNNIAHGIVESGDRLFVYCGSTVPDKDDELSLAFSVDVKSVSADRTTFELGELQRFRNPLKHETIRDYEKRKEQGDLDNIFKCGKQGFNITMLEPKEEEQILRLLG